MDCFCLFSEPEGMSPPGLVTLTPTSVEVKWSPPSFPNGIINEYVIERRLNGSKMIFTAGKVLPTSNLAFVDESAELSPFTVYEYRVKVINGAGSELSQWQVIKTKSTRKFKCIY